MAIGDPGRPREASSCFVHRPTFSIDSPENGRSLRTDLPRRLTRAKERLDDAAVHRLDLAVAVNVVVAQILLVERTERSLHEARVDRIHLPIAVDIPVANPLRIADATATWTVVRITVRAVAPVRSTVGDAVLLGLQEAAAVGLTASTGHAHA